MWEHLAAELGSQVEIVYWMDKYERRYSDNVRVKWVKDLNKYKCPFKPDLVFARGGFDETYPIVKRYACPRIYYGSGVRFKPMKDIFDIILVDSPRQLKKVGPKGRLWTKPTIPIFQQVEARKKYDVCFVGDGRYPFRAKIKRVNWVYKTVPRDIDVLHLGWPGKTKKPGNIHNIRVQRHRMPELYSICKIGVVPYSDYDSAPRIIPEMLACGIYPVIMDSVHFNPRGYGINAWSKDSFWDTVRNHMDNWKSLTVPKPPDIKAAAKEIKEMLP